jgi:pimeloyl-ACP methyl ester carboxylesterase
MSQPGQYLALNGISLSYEVHGVGEPLLLLHGGGGSAAHFERMLPELTQHFQVITPDSRAQGRSTDSEQPLSYRSAGRGHGWAAGCAGDGCGFCWRLE